jgi:hypothetical protein
MTFLKHGARAVVVAAALTASSEKASAGPSSLESPLAGASLPPPPPEPSASHKTGRNKLDPDWLWLALATGVALALAGAVWGRETAKRAKPGDPYRHV